MTVLKLYRIT